MLPIELLTTTPDQADLIRRGMGLACSELQVVLLQDCERLLLRATEQIGHAASHSPR